MGLKLIKFKEFLLLISVAGFLMAGCKGGNGNEDAEDKDTVKVDTVKTNLLKFDNTLFSVPSPIQTSLLIKKSGANYNKGMLNVTSALNSYSTNYKKALNLGVYGADLGYVTIYEQTQDAIGYLKTVKKLADDLGVSGAFDATLMKRFETNMGNRDSLLSLVSVGYRTSDKYLQNNERKDVAVLILAGGWVESLYFSINIAKSTRNQEVINRIGEQKGSLDNLIKLLQPYYQNSEYTEFIDQLVDLYNDFDGITTKYTYVKPTTDIKNMVTTIHSKNDIVITDKQIEAISAKVETIRKQIVG
jgi:hypothetical protein